MSKLCAPYVARGTGGRRGLSSNPFNEGISCSQQQFDDAASRDPALNSRDRKERSEALTKSITSGELAQYRRR